MMTPLGAPPTYDRFAKFSDAELLEGIGRLFKDAKRKQCKCGRLSMHATCEVCRLSARSVIDHRRNKQRRVERAARRSITAQTARHRGSAAMQ